MIKVLLAEDMHMLRGALVALLDLEADIEVVANVASGDAVLPTAHKVQPDVAVLDIDDGPGLVVGYLVLVTALPVAHVDQVYVTPDARELGFGDALLEAATDAAVEAGATVLEGNALPGDRETKNLYERAGVTARLITVSRRLT